MPRSTPVRAENSIRSRAKRAPMNGGSGVFDILRQRIASHDLPPGSKLHESQLAAEFKVSRTIIREAFGTLEERGLIIRIPNRGAVVSRLDRKQVYEIFDVREFLEALCARKAAINAPDGAWEDLIQRFGAPLERDLKRGDFSSYLSALIALRERTLAHADCPIVAKMLDLVYDKAQVIARRVVILPGRAELGLRLHRELLQALKTRNADEAESIKRRIISSARDDVRKYEEFVL